MTGHRLAELGSVALKLMNAKGVARATLEVADRTTPDGMPRVSLALARADGAPTTELEHSDGVSHGDDHSLRFSYGDGDPYWRLGQGGVADGGVVELFSQSGDPVAQLSSGLAGANPFLQLHTPPRDTTSPIGPHPGAKFFYWGDSRRNATDHFNLLIEHGANSMELVTHDGGPTELVLKGPDGEAVLATKP